jgi:hypothetical protein
MKLANANKIRADFVAKFFQFLTEQGEDVGQIESNALNLPVVSDDGEEGWVEIFVKVPKGTKDEEYDGYGRREDYRIATEEKAEKARIASEKKAAKIAADQARRAAKAQKESESGE